MGDDSTNTETAATEAAELLAGNKSANSDKSQSNQNQQSNSPKFSLNLKAPSIPAVRMTGISSFPWMILVGIAIAACIASLRYNKLGGFFIVGFYILVATFVSNNLVEGDDTFKKRLIVASLFSFISVGLGNWISRGTWYYFVLSVFVVFVVYMIYQHAGFSILSLLKVAGIVIIFLTVINFISPLQAFLDGSVPSMLVELSMFSLLIFGYGYPIFFVFSIKHHDSVATLFFSILVVSTILIFVLNQFAPTFMATNLGIVGASQDSDQREMISEIVGDIFEGFRKAPGALYATFIGGANRTKQLFNQSINLATRGKSYEENVDSDSAVGSLGVNFKTLDLTSPELKYYQGDPVSGWAVLESKSLDRNIKVHTSCNVKPSRGDSVSGKISNPTFTIYDQDIRDVLCNFEKHQFQTPGQFVLNVNANFDYSVGSYLRRYYISDLDLRTIRSAGEDAETYLDIPSSDEASIYTNGPLSLSIIKHGLLQPINFDYDEFVVGMRVENNLKTGMSGTLKNISSLRFYLPLGMELKENRDTEGYSCSSEFELLDNDMCQKYCIDSGQISERCDSDCNKYSVYSVDPKTLIKDKEGNIKLPILISCNVEITNPQTFLGTTSYAIKNFRANVDYTYEVGIAKSFTVIEKENYQILENLKEFAGYDTSYMAYTKSNPRGIFNLANESIDASFWKSTYYNDNDWSDLLKAVVAMRYRRGADNVQGIGITGITLVQAQAIDINSRADLESFDANINAFKRYISHLAEGECSFEGVQSLDCAIKKFMFYDINPAPAVIQLVGAKPWLN